MASQEDWIWAVVMCLGYASGRMGRAMADKRAFDWDLVPDTVLYDIFYESGTRLGGAYVARMRAATSPEERGHWLHAQIRLDAERDAIDPNDRKAQIEAKMRWDAERKALYAADG